MPTPWAKFSLPGSEDAYARGHSTEFRETCREIFGPLVRRVREWPPRPHFWLMAEVPRGGSLLAVFSDLEKRPASPRSLLAVLPPEPVLGELSFPYPLMGVQKAGLAAGLGDNKLAGFSARLTSIRFVIPVARRKYRT